MAFEDFEDFIKKGIDWHELQCGGEKFYVRTVQSFYDEYGFTSPIVLSWGEAWSNTVIFLKFSMIAGLIFIVIIGASVFSSEYRYNMVGQTRSTKKGRTKLAMTKLSAMVTTAAIIYISLLVINIIPYGIAYGFEGFNCPMMFIATAHDTFLSGPSGTIGGLFIIYALIGLLAYCAAAFFTLLLSSLFESEYTSTILSLCMLLLPLMLSWNMFSNILPEKINKLIAVLPINIFTIRQTNAPWSWPFYKLSILGEGLPLPLVITFAYLLFSAVSIIAITIRNRRLQAE